MFRLGVIAATVMTVDICLKWLAPKSACPLLVALFTPLQALDRTLRFHGINVRHALPYRGP